MKKSIFHFSFLVPAFLFVLHQLLLKGLGFQFKFFDFYLDPFCLSALSLPLMVIERKKLFPRLSFSIIDVFITLVILIIISEFVFPYFFPNKFTADPWDVLSIILGGFWYLIFHPDQAYRIPKN